MIKFRVWDKLSNMMYTPTSMQLINGEVVQVDIEDNSLNISDGPNTLLLEQFTGLKDVNGKDIYEGDIVHGYDQEPDRDDGYIGSSVTDVVNFKYGAFWIGDSWYKVMVMTPPIVEIIGNVHTNPELLKAG